MRKILWKTFLLCMACLVCVGGLCAAKDKDNMTLMWQDEHINDKLGEKYKYYLDDSATKIIDYEGRKYLQAYFQRNKVFMEQIWFVPMWRESEKAHWTRIYDVERQKSFTLDYLNKDIKQKEGHYNISSMKQNLHDYSELDKKFMQWMETNRKSLLDEIRRANGDASNAGFSVSQTTPQGQTNAVTVQGQSGTMLKFESKVIEFNAAGTRTYYKDIPPDTFYLIRKDDAPTIFGDGIDVKYLTDVDLADMTRGEFPGEFVVVSIVEGSDGVRTFAAPELNFDYDNETHTFYWYDGSFGDYWSVDCFRATRFESPDVISLIANRETDYFYGVKVKPGDKFPYRKGDYGIYWPDWTATKDGVDPDLVEMHGHNNESPSNPLIVKVMQIMIECNGNF